MPAGTAVRSGQFARVQVPGAPVRALLAPAGAVSTLGEMERVFVVAGHAGQQRAVLRLVKTGAIRGPARPAARGNPFRTRRRRPVVLDPPAGLQEGQPLEVQP